MDPNPTGLVSLQEEEETLETSLSFFMHTEEKPYEDTARRQACAKPEVAGREVSPETNSASTLILDF